MMPCELEDHRLLNQSVICIADTIISVLALLNDALRNTVAD